MRPYGLETRRIGRARREGSRGRLWRPTISLLAGVLLVLSLGSAAAQPRDLRDFPPEQETAKLDLGLFKLDLGRGHWVWEPASRRAFCLSLGVSSGLAIMVTNFTLVNLVGLAASFPMRIAQIASVPLLMGTTWAMCGLAAGNLPNWGSFPPWSRGPAPESRGAFF